MKNKDIIQDKAGLNVLINHKNIEMKSKIFCDRIEYLHNKIKFGGKPALDNHLMFWLGKELVFKVWLKQNKEYKNINEALKDVGIQAFNSSHKN